MNLLQHLGVLVLLCACVILPLGGCGGPTPDTTVSGVDSTRSPDTPPEDGVTDTVEEPEVVEPEVVEPMYRLEGLPEFVADLEACTDPDKQYVLPDGYVYAYQPVPTYSVTNQLTVATDETGGVFEECGYRDHARIRSILEIEQTDFSFVTGFIPIQKGDILYFSGNCLDPTDENANNVHMAFYNSQKQAVASAAMGWMVGTAFEVVETNPDGYLSAVKLRTDWVDVEISYVRLTLLGSGRDEVISVNEPLVPGGERYAWVQRERYIPAAWYEEIQDTIRTVNALERSGAPMIRFLFASDIHLGPNPATSYTQNLGKISAEVMRACDIPFFVTGGDNCTQSAEFMPTFFAENLNEVLKQLSPIPHRNILLSVGNHDGATGTTEDDNGNTVYYRFQLTNEERSAVFFDWQRATNENKKFDSDGTYYYMDDKETETRYIILNSFWSQWEGNEDGYVYNIQHSFFHSHRFGSQQLHWLAEVALDMPRDYGAVIVAHFAPAALDFDIFKGIVDAFNDRTTYQGRYRGVEAWQEVTIAVDYTNVDGEIIAIFQGHNHTNAEYDYFDNIPCINTTTTGAYWAVRDENAEERVKGTSSEFAVDVVTIDRVARKIYLTRLGAGEDRVIPY